MNSIKIPNYGDTNFITGMRAWAALITVLIHTGGAGLRGLGPIGNYVADLGRTGVYTFFVISGFCVAQSFFHSKSYKNYFSKRYHRIAPLYFFWLTICGIRIYASTGLESFDFLDIFLRYSFLGFFNYKIQSNGWIGVEWSLPIEMFWYVFVPPLMLLCNTVKKAVVLVLFSLPVILALKSTLNHILKDTGVDVGNFYHWSPIPYFFSFSLGILAFNIRQSLSKFFIDKKYIINLNFFALAVYILLASYSIKVQRYEFFIISIFTFLVLSFGSHTNIILKTLFIPKPIQVIGVLSYGIYLCHIQVMGMWNNFSSLIPNPTVKFLIVAAGSIFVSFLTYKVIEQEKYKSIFKIKTLNN
ncbi:MAG: acyltransferase [Bdellovibrionota bacterium]